MTELIKAGSGKKKKRMKKKIKIVGSGIIRLEDFNHIIKNEAEKLGFIDVFHNGYEISKRARIIKDEGVVRQDDFFEEVMYFMGMQKNKLNLIKKDVRFFNLSELADLMSFSYKTNTQIEHKKLRKYLFTDLDNYPEIELIELNIPHVTKRTLKSRMKGGLEWTYSRNIHSVFKEKYPVENFTMQIIFNQNKLTLYQKSINEFDDRYAVSLLIPMFNSDRRISDQLRNKEANIFVLYHYQNYTKIKYYDVCDSKGDLEKKLKTAIKNYGIRK